MIFNSIPFIFAFLPVALLGFYALTHLRSRIAWMWLVLMSLVFYGYWNIAFVPLLLVSIAFNYIIARLIFATAGRASLQTGLMVLGIASDVGALCYYKYLFSIFAFLNLHTAIDIPFSNVALPLGISFFTFTQIGYLVDVKQGVAKDRDLLDYLLFVTFFPHLIAGPIVHNREMMPQFSDTKNRKFSNENFSVGLTIFFIGLGKKVLIADQLSSSVSLGFANSAHIGVVDAWYAAILYTFQLYFDFSGYTDMAIGLARMFNIRFPMNFNSPFKADSIIDYWQRWHMTLTRFTTMYIFTPISLSMTRRWLRSQPGTIKAANAKPAGFLLLIAVPVVITMTLLGVWHGAGLQYLVFGVLNGLYLVINHAMRIAFPKRKDAVPLGAAPAAVQAGKVLLTCVAVLIAQVFFRSESIEAGLQMLAGMIGVHGIHPHLNSTSDGGASLRGYIEISLLYAFVWLLPNTQQIMGNFDPVLGKVAAQRETALGKFASRLNRCGAVFRAGGIFWSPHYIWAAFGMMIFGTSLTRMTGVSPFLYFQF
jgi:alginate O-acetyltransferase complex protein AlgI